MMNEIEILRHCAGRHDCTKCKKMAYESAHAENMLYCSEYIARAALKTIAKAQAVCEDIINYRIDRKDLCKYCVFNGECAEQDGKCHDFGKKFRFDINSIKDEENEDE